MKGRVLYIEDEDFFAKTISRKLEEADFYVVTAEDGEMGLTKLNSEPFDLVLLDLILPQKSGFEVLEALKKEPETQKIPVVVLSNLSSDADKQRAQELGAVHFYVKVNSTPKEIIEVSEEVLGAKK